jgi:soluble lytic murein transglycosylase
VRLLRRLLWPLAVAAALGTAFVVVDATGPAWYERLRYPLRYDAIVRGHARNYHLDPYLLAAVIYAESKFRADARSKSGAIGLMQLEPVTAEGIAIRTGGSAFRVSDLYDPEINVRYGAWYLRHLLDKYGDEQLALAAYNAGQSNVDRWLRQGKGVAFAETRDYVRRVEDLKGVYRDAYGSRLRLSYGPAIFAHRFSSMRLIGRSEVEPPKSSAPAAKTFAPAGVS